MTPAPKDDCFVGIASAATTFVAAWAEPGQAPTRPSTHTALTATAQAEALRADLDTLKMDLAAAQAQLLDQARLKGELTALRRQAGDQAQLIARLTDRPDSSPPATAKTR